MAYGKKNNAAHEVPKILTNETLLKKADEKREKDLKRQEK